MAVSPLDGGIAGNVFRARRPVLQLGSRSRMLSVGARVGRAAHAGFRQWIVVVGE
jgi:hypothetical protein